MKTLLEQKSVLKALEYLEKDDERTLAELMELCIIPAPSNDEGKRAEYAKRKFEEIGLQDVYIDEVLNVHGGC